MSDASRRICAASELVERGRAVRFRLAGANEVRPAFVVRVDGAPRGYVNRCGHLAMELDWDPGEVFDNEHRYLICATHGARYDPVNGRCVSGRCAGRGLESVPVEETDGEILLSVVADAGLLPDGGEPE